MSLFSKILNVVKKPIAFAAKVGGTLIGLPALGTAAGNLIEKIGGSKKVETMVAKAVESGGVSTTKVAETLQAAGVSATPNNVALVASAIQKVAVATPEVPVQSAAQMPIVATVGGAAPAPVAAAAATTANSPMSKLIIYSKNHWYLVIPAVLVAFYIGYKQFKK
jgi:hypothetical protein